MILSQNVFLSLYCMDVVNEIGIGLLPWGNQFGLFGMHH